MFFIGVFGIENKDKEIRVLDNISCKKCNESTTGRLVKNFDFFHFFFIPIFKWNEKYYVVCDTCSTLYNIEKEKGRGIERGENINITYWDLQEVYKEFYDDNQQHHIICQNCGNKVDSAYKYCPYCGTKI